MSFVNDKNNTNNKNNKTEEISNFNSYFSEIKNSKQSSINVVKLVLNQNLNLNEFIKAINLKLVEITSSIKIFIKQNFQDFLHSIGLLKECKNIVRITEEILNHLHSSIKNFYNQHGLILQTLHKLKISKTIIESEKVEVRISLILVNYFKKIDIFIKEKRSESAITLFNSINEVLESLKSNYTYKRMKSILNHYKAEFVLQLEANIKNKLEIIEKEYFNIGKLIFERIKISEEKKRIKIEALTKEYENNKDNDNSTFSNLIKSSNQANNDIQTMNIKNSCVIMRNTSNVKFSLSRSSLVRNSVMKENSFGLFNMIDSIGYLNLPDIEYNCNLLKKLNPNYEMKNYYYNRKMNLVKLVTDKNNSGNEDHGDKSQFSHVYFYKIIGFVVVEISFNELVPSLFNNKKFEKLANYLFEECNKNIANQFDLMKVYEDFYELKSSTILFLKSVEFIGITENSKFDLKSQIEYFYETLRNKINNINFSLLSNYQNSIMSTLYNEKLNFIIINSSSDISKIIDEFHIEYDDLKENNLLKNLFKEVSSLEKITSPIRIPITNLVYEYKNAYIEYIKKMYSYIKNLYSEPYYKLEVLVIEFVKKMNDQFISFSNFSEGELHMILCASISQNLKFINAISKMFNKELNKLVNVKSISNNSYLNLNFKFDKTFEDAWQSYEELVFEKLKKNMTQFSIDLIFDKASYEEIEENIEDEALQIVFYLEVSFILFQDNF